MCTTPESTHILFTTVSIKDFVTQADATVGNTGWLPQFPNQTRKNYTSSQYHPRSSCSRQLSQHYLRNSQSITKQQKEKTHTWDIPDSNSSGFSPLGFTIFALELNMAFLQCKRTSHLPTGTRHLLLQTQRDSAIRPHASKRSQGDPRGPRKPQQVTPGDANPSLGKRS